MDKIEISAKSHSFFILQHWLNTPPLWRNISTFFKCQLSYCEAFAVTKSWKLSTLYNEGIMIVKLTFILMLKLVQWMQDISDQTHGWNEFDHSSREDRVVEEDSILHVQGVHKIDIICEHPVHISLQCAILFLLSWYCYLGLQWK